MNVSASLGSAVVMAQVVTLRNLDKLNLGSNPTESWASIFIIKITRNFSPVF